MLATGESSELGTDGVPYCSIESTTLTLHSAHLA